jgi:DNA-binding response OmpR family regulator
VANEKIVVIEDEPDILDVLQYQLARERFNVKGVRDGEQGLQVVRAEEPDVVVLDIMLPGMDGIEVCRRLKSDPATQSIPVVMITARGEDSDIVVGLGVGADDYLAKPFSPKVLIARIKAVLRRTARRDRAEEGERVTRDGVVVDARKHEVTVDGKATPFTATEFRLLHFLVTHPGRVFTRDHLMSRVMGEDAVLIQRNVDVHVGSVRKKLGAHRELIETVRGVGYRFRDRE